MQRVRLDRVQDDADTFGELIEKRLVRRIETARAEESSITAFTWPSKRIGRTTMFVGARFAEAGADLNVIGRHVCEEDAFFLQRRLADKSFAELEARCSRPCVRDRRSSPAASAPVHPA